MSFIKDVISRIKSFFEFQEDYDDSTEEIFIEYDKAEYSKKGVGQKNKYRITFDFEVPAEEAEDSIEIMERTFLKRLTRDFLPYNASVDNLDIYAEREYDLGYELEDAEYDYDDISFHDILEFFRAKKRKQVPTIPVQQSKKDAFTVIRGSRVD